VTDDIAQDQDITCDRCGVASGDDFTDWCLRLNESGQFERICGDCRRPGDLLFGGR
jgi:hypothetical protein